MATGLGAFVGGFAKGMSDVQEMEARKQAIERDKERMAMDRDRFALEKVRAEREAQMGEIARQEAQLKLDQAKRDEAMAADMRANLEQFMNETKAGYEAEEISPDGKTVGFRRFQDGPTAIADVKARGNQFRPGSLKRVGEMDEIEKQLLFADRFNSILAKHGKLTPEQMDAARARRKEISSEGALESMRYFLATGDVAGTKDMFAKKGKIKIGDDVMLKVVPDEFTGSRVIGTRMVNGKEQQVFDAFQDVILPSMSPKAYAEIMGEMKKTGAIQKAETERTEKREAGETMRSREANKAAMDREVYRARKDIEIANMKDKGEKDAVGKQLREIMFPLAEKQASQPGFVFNADYYRKNTIEQLDRARYLFETGKVKSLEEAASAAIKELPYNPPKR